MRRISPSRRSPPCSAGANAIGARIAAIGGACALLAEAGLLNARTCAAHWSLADALAEGAPNLAIADRLYVIEERIATCAGRDATLDFALRLIADAAGERLARIVADSLTTPARAKLASGS